MTIRSSYHTKANLFNLQSCIYIKDKYIVFDKNGEYLNYPMMLKDIMTNDNEYESMSEYEEKVNYFFRKHTVHFWYLSKHYPITYAKTEANIQSFANLFLDLMA